MSAASTTTISAARRTQQWLRSRPLLMDVLFAGLMALLALADLPSSEVPGVTREADLSAVALILIGAASLVWRRSAPVRVFMVVVGVSIIFYARDYGSFMVAVGLAGIYAVAAHESNRRTAWVVLATGWAVLFAAASVTLLDQGAGFRWGSALSMTTSIGATIIVGTVIRNKEEIFADTKERADRAEAERKAEAERAITRERLRIAREMHDVVAHGMSLITVQAAAAREIATTRPDDAARLMRSVETTGRDALTEMRRMLGVLRNDEVPASNGRREEMVPQPSLDDLGSIIAHCNEAGTPTDLVINGDQRHLPAGVELAAFRIVQEALTNVVKHGGHAATATVVLRYDVSELHITICDSGRGVVSGLSDTASGHGLVGMRERIEIYGGQLTTGPRPGGGYVVKAALPINAPSDRPAVLSADSETIE